MQINHHLQHERSLSPNIWQLFLIQQSLNVYPNYFNIEYLNHIQTYTKIHLYINTYYFRIYKGRNNDNINLFQVFVGLHAQLS